MKRKKLFLYFGIIAVIAIIATVSAIIYSRKTENKKEQNNKIVESELTVNTENLCQYGQFMSGSSFNDSVAFQLSFKDVGYEVVCWDKYAAFRVKREKGAGPPVYLHRLAFYHYQELQESANNETIQQKVQIEWVPYDSSAGLKEDEEEAGENAQISLNMNHYVYVALTQNGYITGLLVLKFPVENLIFKEIELVASIQFEKQNGKYQNVTRKYIEKRVKEIIQIDAA